MQIDRLNRSIRRHKFGRSSYEFVCTCNEDYREYYNLITNKELNGHNLLNTKVYEENEELIHELFNKISSLSSMQDPKKYQELQKEVQLLSRFTTYLKFDILENGNSLRATIAPAPVEKHRHRFMSLYWYRCSAYMMQETTVCSWQSLMRPSIKWIMSESRNAFTC